MRSNKTVKQAEPVLVRGDWKCRLCIHMVKYKNVHILENLRSRFTLINYAICLYLFVISLSRV